MAFLVLTLRCSAGHHQRSDADANQTCLSELGEGATVIPSPGNTYILCRKKVRPDKKVPEPTFDYIIIQQKPVKIVYKGKILSGKITWYSDEEVLISEKLGILGGREQNVRTYRVNVKTGRITEVGEHNKL